MSAEYQATANLTLGISVSTWDVTVSIMIQVGATTRKPFPNEVEVKLQQKNPLAQIVQDTDWRLIADDSGKYVFRYAEYPDWLIGYDGVFGANWIVAGAHFTGSGEITAVYKDLRLGTSTYSDPGQYSVPAGLSLPSPLILAIPVVGSLAVGLLAVLMNRKR